MSTNHTPGRLVHDQRGYPHADLRSESGRGVAVTWGACSSPAKTAQAHERRTAEDRANTRRLAACWNACDGMPTEHVEELAGIDRGIMRLAVQADDYRRQRDALMVALAAMIDEDDGGMMAGPARELLAKIRGEA